MTSPRPPGDPLWSETQGPSDQDEESAVESSGHYRRRPWPWRAPSRGAVAAALGVVAVIVVALVAVVVVTRDDEGPELIPVIAVDGWAPYWTLDDSAEEISGRDGSMREVSPFWFRATGVDQITFDPNASADLTQEFLDDADEALIVPSIVDGLAAGEMAAILADPDARRRHVEAIDEFATAGGYDGIDLNYEQFAFADGRDTWEETRPNWVSFVAELAEELHADGRTLTVSIPVVYDAGRTADSGFWVYDYAAMADHVDRIRMMAYDYSVGDPGPIAPLSFVQRAIDGAIEATGQPEKLVLGLPAYGRNWPVTVAGECPEPDEEADISVPGVTTVTARSVDDLIERRDAVPEYDPATGEWSFEYELEISDDTTACVQTRQVHYVDADGVRQRMDMAISEGLSGVSLWALGFEDDDVWDAILVDASIPDLA
jgi:spore germination protein YaaH